MFPCERSRLMTTVHPHGRGDNAPLPTVTTHDHGSPPRAWGQFSGVCPGAVQFRFTPTGVGTIDRRRPSGRGTTVHPHGRGDNINRRRPCRATRGSPPRAWGQLLRRSIRHHRRRFTPTGVGTISRCWRKLVNCAVHPHGRGDNDDVNSSLSNVIGSPPRAWGQSPPRPRLCDGARFTPTGVGTIIQSQSGTTCHPGSPPRAWGQ